MKEILLTVLFMFIILSLMNWSITNIWEQERRRWEEEQDE